MRYWKFLATCALFLLTIQVGINGYRAGTEWQRVELDKARLIIQTMLAPVPAPTTESYQQL